jgi:hypothetical protein
MRPPQRAAVRSRAKQKVNPERSEVTASDIQDLLAEFGVQLESAREYELLAARFTPRENLGPLAAPEMDGTQRPKTD